MFKSKTNSNLEELDQNFIQSYNSNKSSSERDSFVNMGDNNNTLDIVNDKWRSIREYAVFDLPSLHTSIVKSEVTTVQFEFKLIMFQILQTIGQSSGVDIYDYYLHLNQFTEVVENFKIACKEDDGFKLRLFPYSLT